MTSAAAVRTESARWSTEDRRLHGRVISAIRDRIETSPDLTPGKVRVMLRIARYDDYGRNPAGCYASNETLAQKACMSLGHLRRVIAELTDGGWLEREHQPTRKRTPGYRILRLGPRALVLPLAHGESIDCRCAPEASAGARRSPSEAGETPKGVPEKEKETTTTRASASSSFPRIPGPESPRTAQPPGPDQPRPVPRIAEGTGRGPAAAEIEGPRPGYLDGLVNVVAMLQLRETKGGGLIGAGRARELIVHHAGNCPGGLRSVAWAIDVARNRPGPDRAAVHSWGFIVGTLGHWRGGPGLTPAGWPDLGPEPAKAATGHRAASAAAESPPPDRAELEETIRRLEGLGRRKRWQDGELASAKAELAKLDGRAAP